jgi:hypothetical protein
MDLSSIQDGNAPEQEEKPTIEYSAQATSPIANGEAKLTIGENSFIAATLFDTVELAFAEINTLSFSDYLVTVEADSGTYVFSRMGQWAQSFYDALCDAYSKALLRSLFIKGEPIVTARGDYSYTEKGIDYLGTAAVHVYENNVTALPSDLSARRVPLCFVTGMNKGDYELTLSLDTGESYSYRKLGYATTTLTSAVEKQIRALRERSLLAAKEIEPSLSTVEASQIAKLMPQGAALRFGQIAEISPSFVTALEKKLANTRAAEYYEAFKELSDPMQIHIGFRKNETAAKQTSADDDAPAPSLGPASSPAPNPSPDPYLLWLIAPSPDGQYAAVEFAEADSATFVYRTGGNFSDFARQLNRALEAIDFKREVIRMSDEEIRRPENADYYMASKRTVSLQLVRSSFVARIVHTSLEAWKRKLTEII